MSATNAAAALPYNEIRSGYLKLENAALDARKGPKLSPSQRYLYIVLVRHSYGYHKNWADCSLDYLCKFTNLSVGTVRSSLKYLKSVELVEEIAPWVFQVHLFRDLTTSQGPKLLPAPAALVDSLAPTPEPLPTALEQEQILSGLEQNLTSISHAAPDVIDSNQDLKTTKKDTPLNPLNTGNTVQLCVSDLAFTKLETLPQAAIDQLVSTNPVFTVIRVLLTLLTQYRSDSKSVQILNLIGLIKFALNPRNNFLFLSDTEITERFQTSIYRARCFSVVEKWGSKQDEELKRYSNWLEENKNELNLELLWDSYYKHCPETSKMGSFLVVYNIPKSSKDFTF